MENPLFGYIGRKIDVVGDQNPGYLHDDSDQWHSLNIASSQKTADFLNIKYIIFKNDVFNNKIIFPQLQKMGYKIVQKQAIYTLLMREPQKKEFLKAIYDDGGCVALRTFKKTNEIKRNLTLSSNSLIFIKEIKNIF